MLRTVRAGTYAFHLLLALWAVEAPLASLAGCVGQPQGPAGPHAVQHHDHGAPHSHRLPGHLCCDLCTVAATAGVPRTVEFSLRPLALYPSPLLAFAQVPARSGLLGSIALPPSLGPPAAPHLI